MSKQSTDLVFIHGWSVTSTDTYGGLPERLVAEAHKYNLDFQAKHIYLGRYISFHDEVQIQDIAHAMETAVADEELGKTNRFACLTHSTGGPVIREWFERFYAEKRKTCPMSHLVMLAPANFGSALAQLGKGRLGRMKAWFGGVEPGKGVLDWLELGSPSSIDLNKRWIEKGGKFVGAKGYFPFVLTGQSIDRKAYDHLNNYTGELGSDGVVRVASANLRSSYLRLTQYGELDSEGYNILRRSATAHSPSSPMRILKDKSHSGNEMGIMRSIRASPGTPNAQRDGETIDSILRCLKVKNETDYTVLASQFDSESDQVQLDEQVEVDDRTFLSDREFVHDRFSQLTFRVKDSEGFPVNDFDLLFTAGDESDPDHLPRGFLCDRQRNQRAKNTLTFLINYDVMVGCEPIPNVRGELPGVSSLGFTLHPRPDTGFVRYRKCRVSASKSMLKTVVRPNQTTLVDIVVDRLIDEEVLRLEQTLKRSSFKKARPKGGTVG